MRIPVPPVLRPVPQISPSAYETMLHCKARAAWSLHGDRRAVPQHPKALLGVCFHRTIADAHAGRVAGADSAARIASAREAFDGHARRLHEDAHPLLRAKFSTPERLPYYNLFRERAALEGAGATDRTERMKAAAGQRLRFQTSLSESKFASRDGLVAGRPDFVDPVAKQVIDYKTGVAPPPGQPPVSEAEARQLRLYAHLACENDIEISEGVISRNAGQSATIVISREAAAAEGQAARKLLAEFNGAAGSAFVDAAQPSAAGCAFCPCIPFCDAFWQKAAPVWADECGTHVEGTIRTVEDSAIQGMKLKTFGISVGRGTVVPGEIFVEQVPDNWITADGTESPVVGDLLRVVAARAETDGAMTLVRIDRVSTSIWSNQRSGDPRAAAP